jgi:hypothetical protein
VPFDDPRRRARLALPSLPRSKRSLASPTFNSKSARSATFRFRSRLRRRLLSPAVYAPPRLLALRSPQPSAAASQASNEADRACLSAANPELATTRQIAALTASRRTSMIGKAFTVEDRFDHYTPVPCALRHRKRSFAARAHPAQSHPESHPLALTSLAHTLAMQRAARCKLSSHERFSPLSCLGWFHPRFGLWR